MKLNNLIDLSFIVVIFTLISDNGIFAASINKNHISRHSAESNILLRIKEQNRQCGYKVRFFLPNNFTVRHFVKYKYKPEIAFHFCKIKRLSSQIYEYLTALYYVFVNI